MVRIRLARGGAKNRPCYRVVVTDSRNARDGRFIEKVGFLNVVLINFKDKGIFLNLDRINYWLQRGAIVSSRVYSIIKSYKKRSML